MDFIERRKQLGIVELTNDFHNTSLLVNIGMLNRAQARRVRNALCGIADCKCGETELRTRGKQPVNIEPLSGGKVRISLSTPEGGAS